MTPIESLACLCLFILSVYIVWKPPSMYIRGTTNAAPYARGLPVVGGTLSLALQGADFIHTCRKRYGDIVRVSLGGQGMTYLFGPDAMKLFFSASDDQIGFRPATEHFTGRVFGLPSHLFFPHHTALLQGLRAQLTHAQLPLHGHALLSSMQLESDRILTSSGKADLMCSIKDTLFPAAVKSIFGAAFLQCHGIAQLQKAFFAFEEGFELAASPVPHLFQPSFCKARQTLLQAFRVSWAAGHFGDTVVGLLLQEVPELHGIAPHVLLALLWASLANTIPATFWALAFLLLPDNQEHKQQILLVLQSMPAQASHACLADARAQQQTSPDGRLPAAIGSSEAVAVGTATAAPGFDAATHAKVAEAKGPATSEAAAPALDTLSTPPDARGPYSNDGLVTQACDRSSLLAGCVAEAVRVRAPGVAVRMATCDLAMPLAPGQCVHISKVKQVLPHGVQSQGLPLQLNNCRSSYRLMTRTGQSNSVA
ncbi:TPA: Cytochrome P450 7B1, variant 4 [Trebouxia sp. C0004]